MTLENLSSQKIPQNKQTNLKKKKEKTKLTLCIREEEKKVVLSSVSSPQKV